ncbi:zinc finger, CCHC-type containing protein [Tanacetum coccineum]|uniref:Zinc finger, CCHC-type containing protein n=1 Tax=Tanacetum coccineum TaxID=301880 RepID=A0ABQ5ILX5_9ASTR
MENLYQKHGLNLALYNHEGWNDAKEFVKPVKDISTPYSISKTPDRRLLELEDQINFLLKGSRPTPRPSSTHIPEAHAEAVYSNPRPQNQNETSKQNPFTFRERTRPNHQSQALGTTFEARVRDYMAAHTERMKRFKNAIFKQREEINDIMTEMFGLLKELMTSKAPEKVLIREEAKFPVTKNINYISLSRGEEEISDKNNIAIGDNTEKPTKTETPAKKAEKGNEAESKAKNKETTEAPSSQPVEYYLKHRVNEKLIDGLVDNHRPAETDIRLSLASRSYIYPLGIAEDILVEVAKHVYPMDFVILDIKEDKKRPFILGIPFLTMAKALIKFDKGSITLRFGKGKISFHRIPESFCKIKRRVKNDLDPIAPTMSVNRLVLEWEERIKLHLERERKFNQWKSKNFKSKHPALVKVEGEMDGEGEVTKFLIKNKEEIFTDAGDDGRDEKKRLDHLKQDLILNGAFGGVEDEEVVVGEGVVVTSSSVDMLTNSCLRWILVNLIFLVGLEEEALVEFMVKWPEEDEDDDRSGEDDLFN